MKIKYEEYIQSDKWRLRRQQVLDNPYYGRPHQCLICHGVKSLAVHHMSYDHLGEELDHELCILCSECHHRVHYKNAHHSNDDIDINVFLLKFYNGYSITKKKKKKKSKVLKNHEQRIDQWKSKKKKKKQKEPKKTSIHYLGAVEYFRRKRESENKL